MYQYTVLNMIYKVKLFLTKNIRQRRKSLKWDVKLNLIILNLQELNHHPQDFALMKIMITLYKVILKHKNLKFLQSILQDARDLAPKYANQKDKFLIS